MKQARGLSSAWGSPGTGAFEGDALVAPRSLHSPQSQSFCLPRARVHPEPLPELRGGDSSPRGQQASETRVLRPFQKETGGPRMEFPGRPLPLHLGTGGTAGSGAVGLPDICESRSGHRHACPHGPQARDVPSSCFQLFVSSLHAALLFLGTVAFFSPVSGRNAPRGKESLGGLGSIVAAAQSQSSWVTPAGPLVQMGK